jgi:hypothetical protein
VYYPATIVTFDGGDANSYGEPCEAAATWLGLAAAAVLRGVAL